jgi:hypothetical protein
MSKRFTDTEKWRKGFVRSLDAPYKLLWLYILDECDHAGIWHVELDVACLRVGFNLQMKDAIETLGKHIYPFDDGEKWFIHDFISFQYGELNENNRVHQSVIRQLKKYGLWKVYASPLQRAKDKDKEKEKEKAKGKDKEEPPKKQKTKRAIQLPDDWEPNKKHHEIAVEFKANLSLETEKFRDWALSKGETKKDWDAAFRNWLRRAKNGSQGLFNGERLTAAEQLSRRNDEAIRTFLAEGE